MFLHVCVCLFYATTCTFIGRCRYGPILHRWGAAFTHPCLSREAEGTTDAAANLPHLGLFFAGDFVRSDKSASTEYNVYEEGVERALESGLKAAASIEKLVEATGRKIEGSCL